jgi:WD repeat-containing protein 61
MSLQQLKEITGHAGAVYCCTSKGDYIYTGSADKYVTRWKIDEGTQDQFAIKFEQSVYALCVTNEDLLVVGLANGGLHFFDVISRKELKFYTQHTQAIFSITYNAIKKHLYVADADGNLSVWSSDGAKLVIYLPLGCGKVRSIDVNNSGDHFVLACQDGTIRLFESEYFNEIVTMEGHKGGATAVLFHPLNTDQLITGGKDALLKLWNWKSGEELNSVVAHTFAIYAIASINDGKTLVTASRDKCVKEWSSSLDFIQRLDRKLGGHQHSVNDLCVIDKQTVASCSDDKRIILWELKA